MRVRTAAWALYRMSRPPQLLLVATVYLLGAAVAAGHGARLDAAELAGGFCALLPVAASIHYANEYADHGTDALTTPTPFSGGSQALATTGLPPRLALVAGLVAAGIGAVVAGWLLVVGYVGVAATAVLALGGVFGWAYSVGPALAWRGLGEVDNAALGGLALPAYGYAVVRGTVTSTVLAACLPFAALVFANLLDTTWPDREADAAVGKETLATRWPPERLRATYLASVVAALALLPVLWVGGVLPGPVALASLAVTPLLAWGQRWYTRRRSPFPTVAAMVSLAVLQLIAWARVAGLV